MVFSLVFIHYILWNYFLNHFIFYSYLWGFGVLTGVSLAAYAGISNSDKNGDDKKSETTFLGIGLLLASQLLIAG